MSGCSKERGILCMTAISLSFEHISTQNICICSTQKLNVGMGVYMCVCAGVCVCACVCVFVCACVCVHTHYYTHPSKRVCRCYIRIVRTPVFTMMY